MPWRLTPGACSILGLSSFLSRKLVIVLSILGLCHVFLNVLKWQFSSSCVYCGVTAKKEGDGCERGQLPKPRSQAGSDRRVERLRMSVSPSLPSRVLTQGVSSVCLTQPVYGFEGTRTFGFLLPISQ